MFLEHISRYEFAKAHLSRNWFASVVGEISPRTKGIGSSCAASVANGTVSLHHIALFFPPITCKESCSGQEAAGNC